MYVCVCACIVVCMPVLVYVYVAVCLGASEPSNLHPHFLGSSNRSLELQSFKKKRCVCVIVWLHKREYICMCVCVTKPANGECVFNGP